jgi:hypothetical protein
MLIGIDFANFSVQGSLQGRDSTVRCMVRRTKTNKNVTESRYKIMCSWFTMAKEFQKPLWQHSKRASLGAM